MMDEDLLNSTNRTSGGFSTSYLVPAEIVFRAVLFLLSLVGNVTLIHLIRRTASLWNFCNLMICNKALVDLTCSLVLVLEICWILAGQPLDNIYRYTHAPMILLYSSACLSLVIISVDRFLIVMYPFMLCRRFRSPRVAIPTVWFLSALAFTPIAVINATDSDGTLNYTSILFVYCMFLFMPLVTMTVLYSVIIISLWGQTVPSEDTAARAARRSSNIKVTRILGIASFLFAGACLPLACTQIYVMTHNSHTQSAIMKWLYVLCFLDGALTPYLYFTMSSSFKAALKDFHVVPCTCLPKRTVSFQVELHSYALHQADRR